MNITHVDGMLCFDVYNVCYSLHVGLLVVTLLDKDLIIAKGWQMPSNMCRLILTPYLLIYALYQFLKRVTKFGIMETLMY